MTGRTAYNDESAAAQEHTGTDTPNGRGLVGSTNNHLTGAANGPTVQANCISGDVNFNSAPNGAEEATDSKTFENGKISWFQAGIVVVCILVFIAFIARRGDGLPAERGARPQGSSDVVVLDAVANQLSLCAQSVVLQPENCPQSTTDLSFGEANNVHWILHGNPTDGALLSWHDDRFYVRDNAVMTVTYTNYDRVLKLESQVVPFQAEVMWHNGSPAVMSLTKLDSTDKVDVKKGAPGTSPLQIDAVLRDAFQRCFSVNFSPMPSGCPATASTPQLASAKWAPSGDPLLNTRQIFDSPTGIIHVIGSYSATVQDTDSTRLSAPVQSGSYDASLIEDGDRLTVMQIQQM